MIEQDILDLIDKCVKGDDTHSGASNATVSAPLVQQPKEPVGNAVPLNQPAVVETPKAKRDDHDALFF